MRAAVLVVLFCAGFVVAVFGGRIGRSQVHAQRPTNQHFAAFGSSAEIIALSSDAAAPHQQITLIDPKSRVMSVYHIDRASGAISLKSVRNVHWDLQMDEFNAASPAPREIRSLLEQR